MKFKVGDRIVLKHNTSYKGEVLVVKANDDTLLVKWGDMSHDEVLPILGRTFPRLNDLNDSDYMYTGKKKYVKTVVSSDPHQGVGWIESEQVKLDPQKLREDKLNTLLNTLGI